VSSFPESLIASNGKILFDFSQALSGKKAFPVAQLTGLSKALLEIVH
jgi:hypothetical protein